MAQKDLGLVFYFADFDRALFSGRMRGRAILDRQLHDDGRCSFKSRAGVNYQAVTTLPKGIKINVIGRDGYWLKVESKHGGKPGYVDEQFARPEASAPAGATTRVLPPVVGSYRTLREIELHEKPAANSPVVAKLPAGIKVNVIRAEGEWLRVESKMGGKAGYLEKTQWSVGRMASLLHRPRSANRRMNSKHA